MDDIFTIIGDPHIVHKSLDTATKLFQIVEDLGRPCLWTGDILDNKEIIRGKCLNLFFEYLKNSKLNHIIIVGNHDYFNLDCEDHSLRTIGSLPNVIVVDKPTELYGITFIPYVHNIDHLREALNVLKDPNRVLFAHLDVMAFDYGNGQLSDKGLTLDDLKGFKRVISGHYHKFQQNSNLTYIGSPFTHSWGESDQTKYIGQYTVSKDELLFMETKLPKHVTFPLNLNKLPSDQDLDSYFTGNAGNYLRVLLYGSQPQISAFPRDKYPQSIKWIPKPDDVVLNSVVLEEGIDNTQQFIKWAKEIKGLDQGTLDLGLSILEGLRANKG